MVTYAVHAPEFLRYNSIVTELLLAAAWMHLAACVAARMPLNRLSYISSPAAASPSVVVARALTWSCVASWSYELLCWAIRRRAACCASIWLLLCYIEREESTVCKLQVLCLFLICRGVFNLILCLVFKLPSDVLGAAGAWRETVVLPIVIF